MSRRLVHLTTTDMSLDWLLGPQLRAFRDAGYEVIGVSAPGPHVARLEADGIRHVALANATRAMALHRDAGALLELWRLLRALRPDIVHTHNPKPGVYGRLAARAAGVPLVVNTVHGLYALPDDPLTKRAAVYALERLAASCSDVELIQNPEDVGVLLDLGVPAERVRLLGNGVDLRRFDPAAVDAATRARVRASWGVGDDDVVIGAVGRLVEEKGYRELFAAHRRLARSPGAAAGALGRRPRLVVVGPGDSAKADALDDDERRAAEADGVRFVGERHDMEAVYASFDVYVLASRREGFPRSAMEAAAMGLPIVATDIRGCRQVVADGRTGVLVPVGSPRHLADALAVLVTDEGTRRAMGAAARAKATAEFDQQQVIDITLAVYEAGLGSRRGFGRSRRRRPPAAWA